MKDLKKIKKLRYKKFKTLKLLRLNFTYIKRFSKKKHYRKLKHTVGLLKVLSTKFNLNKLICRPTVLFSNLIVNKYTGFYLNTLRFIKPTSGSCALESRMLPSCKLPKQVIAKYLTNLRYVNVVGSKDILPLNSLKNPQTPPTLYIKKVLYNQSYTYTKSLVKHLMSNSSLVPSSTNQKNQSYTDVSFVKLLFLF